MSLGAVYEALALNTGDSYVSRKKEIETLESYRSSADLEESQKVVSSILANAPRSAEPNSVGEYLYGCAIEQTEAPTGCVPSCVNGYSIESVKCRYAVYKRSDQGTIKINKVMGGGTVYLYIPYRDSSELSEEELEIFKAGRFTKVIIYQYPKKGINYEFLIERSIPRDSTIRAAMITRKSTGQPVVVKSRKSRSTHSNDSPKRSGSRSSKRSSSIDKESEDEKSSEGKPSKNKSSEDKSSKGKSSKDKSSKDKSSDDESSKNKSSKNKSSEDKSSKGKSSKGKSSDDGSSKDKSLNEESSKSKSSSDESSKSKSSSKDKSSSQSKNSSNVFGWGWIIALIVLILIIVIAYLIYQSGWLCDVGSKLETIHEADAITGK